MEQFSLTNDLTVFCVTADSFPDGVQKAHQSLHALISYTPERQYFGLSWPAPNGNLIYKAAAEELIPEELSKHGLEQKVIPKGQYLCMEIHDFMKDIPAIGKAFQQLIADPRIDPDGFCIEWYLSDNAVRCMVKMR